MAQIYEIYGTDAHEMTKSLMKAADVCVMGCPPTATDIPESDEEKEWLEKQDFSNSADEAYTG